MRNMVALASRVVQLLVSSRGRQLHSWGFAWKVIQGPDHRSVLERWKRHIVRRVEKASPDRKLLCLSLARPMA
jgi:hypothetical protein